MSDRDPHVADWSSRAGIALAVGALLMVTNPPWAEACGPILPAAHPLSPPPAAVNVPLNAVLIASSSHRTVRFTLREVVTGKTVPIAESCEAEGVVRMCQGRPGPLAPSTAYAWSATPAPQAGEVSKPGGAAPPTEQIFTTGVEIDDRPALTNLTSDLAPLLAVELLEHQGPSASPCVSDIVRLRLTIARLDEPVVLAASGMNGGLPHGLEERAAPLLTPAAPSTERLLYAPPACLAVHLLDVAGNVTYLPPWCPPGDGSRSAGVTTPAPAPDTAACSTVPSFARPGTLSGLATLASILVLLARCGRRSPRR